MEKKILTVLTLAMFSGAALAASDKGHGMKGSGHSSIGEEAVESSFETLDDNGDGFLTQEEVADVVEPTQEFGKADADGDGRLSQAEYDDYIAQAHAGAGGKHGAGMSSSAQQGAVLPPFESLDTNQDGMVSRSEYEAAGSQQVQGSQGMQSDTGAQGSEDDLIVLPIPPGADALVIEPPQ